MHIEIEPVPEDFYVALWMGALLIAGSAVIDPFPAELDELAEEFFTLFRPIARA